MKSYLYGLRAGKEAAIFKQCDDEMIEKIKQNHKNRCNNLEMIKRNCDILQEKLSKDFGNYFE